MRILHVAQFAEIGGIETSVPALLAALEDRGHPNVVLYSGNEPPALRRVGRLVQEVPDVTNPGGAAGRELAGLVRQALDQSSADLVAFHAPTNAILAGRLMDTLPSVYFAHNYSPICPSGAFLYQRNDVICELVGVPNWRCLANAYLEGCNTRRPTRLLRLYRSTSSAHDWVRRADLVVCDSAYVADRYRANGVAEERLRVLPPPIPLPAREVLPTRAREPFVLFVGRVTPYKGLDYLLRAMARIGARLVVAGDGYALPAMRVLAERLGIAARVDFLGSRTRAEVDDLYGRALVVAVSSVWPEPWGLVGPEAMAHGIPVVAFRVGGIPEWLNDGETGFLVEPKDVDTMATRISQLLDDASLAQRLGDRGRAVAEQRFNFDRHIEGMLDVFRDAVAARGAANLPAVATAGRS